MARPAGTVRGSVCGSLTPVLCAHISTLLVEGGGVVVLEELIH